MLVFVAMVVIVVTIVMFTRKSKSVVVMSICGNAQDVKDVQNFWKGELVVYDKCTSCAGIPKCKVLPNVGREQHTWLTYVIDNYESLPKDIYFLPGPIHKHRRFERFKNGPQPDIIGPHESFVLDSWGGAQLTPAVVRPFRKWFETYIGPWDPRRRGPGWYGIAKTTRKDVRKKSIEFYKELHKQTEVSRDTEVAHYLERAMYAVFT